MPVGYQTVVGARFT